MTNPPSDESTGATAPVSPPADAAAPPAADAPPPPPPPAVPPPAAPPGYPFAPVARPPRVPWVNPERRAHIIAVVGAGALVLLGGGIGIGFAAGDGGHHRGDGYRMEIRPGGYYNLVPGRHGGFVPRFPGAPQFPTAPAPTPAPTATK